MTKVKTVKCTHYRRGEGRSGNIAESTTLVKVSPKYFDKEITPDIHEAFKAHWQSLEADDWKAVITTSVDIASNDDPELFALLQYGVWLIPEEYVAATQYVSRVTPYQWQHICKKSPSDAIGRGQLPGDVGEWVKKLRASEPNEDA